MRRSIALSIPVLAMLIPATAYGEPPSAVEFHHLYTFGSKEGIHPPRILNRKSSTAVMGYSDHPNGLGYPVGVTTDLRGRVWITDSGTISVHVFDPTSGDYREIRKVGDVILLQPSGIASDAQGRIYLVDSGLSAVFVFDEKGEYDRCMVKRSSGVLERPTTIALSEDGKSIYVADPPRNAIVEVNREGEVNSVIHLPAELSQPGPLAVAQNQIYVEGESRHKVGIFSPAGKPRGQIRWDGIAVPSAFTYDPAHRWFMAANPQWMIVQIFDGEGRNLGSFGQMGSKVDQVQRIDALYADPRGLAYVIDSHNGKVVVFMESQVPR